MPTGFAPAAQRFTFLFTDIEGSTRLWAADPAGMSASLRLHDELVREVVERHRGEIFSTAGDGFNVVFADSADAVACAQATQHALDNAPWPGPALRVRMGVHSGEAEARDGDFFGPDVNTAARVGDAGHGGQIVISEAVRLAAGQTMTTDLGRHRLKGVPEPVHLHQLGDERYPALRVVLDTLSSLPSPATSFIGREQEIIDIRSNLLDDRLVTVVGPGGSGKTRIAIEIAMREIAQRKHGGYFADLSAVSDEDAVVATIAQAIRLQLGGGDATQQVLDHLEDKDVLVVLDNCEHLLEACADFGEAMLRRRGEWRLLVTTREHLGIDGERVARLRPLPDDVSGSAVDLFIERANAVRPDLEGVEFDRVTVAELCARLDGLPLAIELAAARVVGMSPAEMLDRMDDRLRLLSGGRSRNRRRVKTLEATLDWSYDLLGEDEQQLFDSLGAITGAFDSDLAAAVADMAPVDAAEILESLVAKSLVTTRVEDGRTWFQLLETMRAYADDRLRRADGALAEARDRHLRHHLDAIAATVESAGSWVEWRWDVVRRWLPTLANLESAIDWAIVTGRSVDAADLLISATPLWREQLSVQQTLDRIELVTEAGMIDRDRRERLLVPEIQFAMTVNDRDRAMPFLAGDMEIENMVAREFQLLIRANMTAMTDPAQSLALTEEAAEAGFDAFAFWDKNRADVHLFAGDYFEAARILTPMQGDNLWAVIDGTIAIAHLMDGRPADALAVAKDHPMFHSIRMSFGLIAGLCHLALGEIDEARRELLTEARTASLGRMSLIANSALVGLAALAHHEGDTEWAREIILESRCQREVAVNALARMVADEIGVLDAFVAQQVEAFSSGDSAANDRTDFLRATLARFEDR